MFLIVGAALAVAAANSARRLLFGLQPHDPAAIAGAMTLLPAIASRLDPSTAIRHE